MNFNKFVINIRANIKNKFISKFYTKHLIWLIFTMTLTIVLMFVNVETAFSQSIKVNSSSTKNILIRVPNSKSISEINLNQTNDKKWNYFFF